MTDRKHYLNGHAAYGAFMNSPSYAGFDKGVSAEDVMRLFLPPVNEAMTSISSPLPKARREWIKGWNKARDES